VRTVLFDLTILATETKVRGIGRYLSELARALGKATAGSKEMRVRFLERADWAGEGSVSDDAEKAISRLVERPWRDPRHAWAYRQRLGMARAARAQKVDLVHIGYGNARPLGRLDCPRVVTCHDLIPLLYPDRYADWQEGWARGRRWLDEQRYHGADHVIAISQATKGDLVRLLGVPERKISVVPNGIDLSKWKPRPSVLDAGARARFRVEARPYLVYAGDADWRKNAEGMLAGLAGARARLGDEDLCLVWAGFLREDRRREVLDRARDLGVENALILTGFVSDDELHALYRGALATLLVSHAEGFGYPVLEAMALGCPAITSNCSSLPELAGDAALLVDPRDHSGIAAAISALAENPAERQRLIAKGQLRAKEFTVERQAQKTLEVYAAVLGGSC
jgi:glycosyltransferase involved in cell wall biosynthesis